LTSRCAGQTQFLDDPTVAITSTLVTRHNHRLVAEELLRECSGSARIFLADVNTCQGIRCAAKAWRKHWDGKQPGGGEGSAEAVIDSSGFEPELRAAEPGPTIPDGGDDVITTAPEADEAGLPSPPAGNTNATVGDYQGDDPAVGAASEAEVVRPKLMEAEVVMMPAPARLERRREREAPSESALSSSSSSSGATAEPPPSDDRMLSAPPGDPAVPDARACSTATGV
jgi:hypothetical protein